MEKIQTVQVEQGLFISLEFAAFDIARNSYQASACYWNYLTITDGDGTTLLEKSCGSLSDGTILIGRQSVGASLPANITSRTNLINLEFKTSSNNAKSGWSVAWTATNQGECQKYDFLTFCHQVQRARNCSDLSGGFRSKRINIYVIVYCVHTSGENLLKNQLQSDYD